MKALVFAIFTLHFLLSGCDKLKNDETKSGKELEFYLLKSFEHKPKSYAIIDSTVILGDSALIKYEDIIWYDFMNQIFKVSAKASEWLNDFEQNKTHGRPFAVTIDKRIVYTGYFWAGFSSSIVDWIVIDPLNYSGKNELTVRLGYPGLFPGMNIPDKRNDSELLHMLNSDNKLKFNLHH